MPSAPRNAVGLFAVAALLGCDAERTTVPTMEGSSAVAEGNGLPDNGHARLYKFNLIGVPKDKKPDMTVDAGKRMFVKLEDSRRSISRRVTTSTSSTPTPRTERRKIPAPGSGPGRQRRDVVRSLHPAGRKSAAGSATIGSCIEGDLDPTLEGEETLCSTETRLLVRGTGKAEVENVSKELLSLCLDLDASSAA